jgi:hypothetical protein
MTWFSRGFLIWAQENILITKIWALLRSDFSQIAQISVPLIMHCLTLPGGADTLHTVVNKDMTSPTWNLRFSASLLFILQVHILLFLQLANSLKCPSLWTLLH